MDFDTWFAKEHAPKIASHMQFVTKEIMRVAWDAAMQIAEDEASLKRLEARYGPTGLRYGPTGLVGDPQ